MRIPFLLWANLACIGAPLLAVLVFRRPVRGARGWVLVWSTLLLVEGLIEGWLAVHRVHNLWVSYVFSPVANAMVLWALSCWLEEGVARLTARLAIVPLLVVWLILTFAFEDRSSFSRAADPLAYLVGLFAAAYTLIARSRAASGDLFRQDWLWVIAGMALYLGTLSMLGPLGSLLAGSDPARMMVALQLEAALCIVAFLAIAIGMTCQPASSANASLP